MLSTRHDGLEGPHGKHDHAAHVAALRSRVLDGQGEASACLRQAAAARAAGGDLPMSEPFDALARQIGEAAYRVTDAQVAAVVEKLGERAAFEVIVAAALGAGLHRWDRGLAVLKEATSGEARHAPA